MLVSGAAAAPAGLTPAVCSLHAPPSRLHLGQPGFCLRELGGHRRAGFSFGLKTEPEHQHFQVRPDGESGG